MLFRSDEPDPKAVAERVSPLLTPCDRDSPLSNTIPWTIRKAFHLPGSATRAFCARSLRWPGAFTIATTQAGNRGASTISIYIGNGLKSSVGEPRALALPRLEMADIPATLGKLQIDGTAQDEAELSRPRTPPPAEVPAEEEETEE